MLVGISYVPVALCRLCSARVISEMLNNTELLVLVGLIDFVNSARGVSQAGNNLRAMIICI